MTGALTTWEHFLAEVKPWGVSHRLKKRLTKIEIAPRQLEKRIVKRVPFILWTINTIIFKRDAEGMKNSSYFPKNRFANFKCAQMKDNSVPSINLMGSLLMSPNESSHLVCIQWHCGVCEKCFHPWELGVQSPALPWEGELGGTRSSQQDPSAPITLGMSPTVGAQGWEAPRHQLLSFL